MRPTLVSLSLTLTVIFLAGCAMTQKPATPEKAGAAAHAGWSFHVDPAVWTGYPAVTAKTEGPAQTLVFHATSLDTPPRDLGTQTFPDAREAYYVMPVVTRDTYASVEVTSGGNGGEVGGGAGKSAAGDGAVSGTSADAKPLFVWHVLLRPKGERLIDYPGRREMLPPDDFDAYWARAKKELDAVPMRPKISPVVEKNTKTGLLYRVELPTVKNTTIVCWYYVPRAAFGPDGQVVKKFPAVIIMPGYGAEEPPLDRTGLGLITLSINPRNHGPSRAFWKSPVEHMLYNLDDPENYYYKLAALDCLRGAQFVFSRGEVDTKHVGAEGGSQGGLFGIMLAALEPRIACVCSNVTAFSDYPDGLVLGRIGLEPAFRKQLATASPAKAEKIRLSLRYTDGANLVTRVHSPIQINMGGQDPVCPYVCGIVVYNRVPAGVPKEFHVVPDAKHEVPPPMRENNLRWYEKYLGISGD